MKVLRNISPIFSKLVGKQTFESNVKYRPITYLVFAEEDGNNIVYNTFTNMLLQIDTEQKAILKGESYSDSKQIKYFVENWFLVPKDNDDYELCEQTRALVSFVSSVGNPKYDKYTILTTTDCNARCFYCYQIGRDNSRMPMTAKTAEAVAEFIIRNSGTDHPVFITWFGGEPLYNDSVIDLISDRLRESGVKFGSSMISNGYLLTKEIVDRAKSKWNLGSIQIPIDGTEEVYNRCKAYIYKDDPSPYKRVIDNIKTALDSGIRIVVRVNIDNHNIGDAYLLADELADRFASYEKFYIYCFGLYENVGARAPHRDAESRMQLTDNLIAFEEYCNSRGIYSSRSFPENIRTMCCSADNPTAVSIGPDGKLGPCSHMMASDVFGSIYSNKEDAELISSWREYINCPEYCRECSLFPACLRVKNCPENGVDFCDPSFQKLRMYRFKNAMRAEYRKKS